MRSHRRLRLFDAPLLMALATFISACSLVLTLEECEGDGDCDGIGPGLICSPQGLCQAGERPPEPCEDDGDCPGHDDGWRCVDNLCQPPPAERLCARDEDCPVDQLCNDRGRCQEPMDRLGPPCELGWGDYNNPGAFVVGLLLPLTGPEAGFGQPLANAILLAVEDFNSIGGVRGTTVALIGCDTQGQDALAIAGAQHLADVGVQAIIGPDYSNQTIDVANQVTLEAEVVLVSPSATAAAISDLDDDGLVWRTVASDTIQGQALGELVNHLLAERPLVDGDDPDFPALASAAILRRDADPYAEGLADALTRLVPGDRYFMARPYGEDLAGAAAEVIADTIDDEGYGPEVIAIIGSSEAWQLAEFLDGNFINPPIFVFADAARNSERAAAAPTSLRGRVWGTAPQNIGALDYAPYTRFRLRYQEAHGVSPDDFQFAANAFDALYILGLGAAYGGFSGPGIAAGLGQISDGQGPLFDPRPATIQQAMSLLADGQSINFRGASGPLGFDERGDPQSRPTILWCFDDVGLPQRGVLIDEGLEFTPLSCDDDVDAPGCADDSDCFAPANGTGVCHGDGQCLVGCDAGFSPCGNQCLDFETDPNHCGGCNAPCDDHQSCVAGSCTE